MLRRLILGTLAALALSACQDRSEERVAEGEDAPALWRIVDEQSDATEGWLFGTIHALPGDIAWRSAPLDEALGRADLLVVEVANLDDGAAMSRLFEDMAFDTPSPPLAERVSPRNREAFAALLTKARVRSDYFDPMESWAAALALSNIAQTDDAENGVDRALIADFGSREVVELEGAQRQLEIFDRLPEAEQRDLLDGVLEETRDTAEMGELARAWARGDAAALTALTQRGILADPELREALLTDRNRAWTAQLVNLLSTDRLPFVAVGAGHLLGEDGLPALLARSGYRVERVQ